MQTFLPYPNFEESVEALDDRRLGKQRVEARQILRALEKRRTGEPGGWKNHPAVLMWEGHEDALKAYGDAAIREWVSRGFRNAMPLLLPGGASELPPWLGREEFHASHRANLLRKDPGWYGRFGWTEEPAEGYWWPTKEERGWTRR